MQIDSYFDRIWYVHADKTFDSMWTTRTEARARKAQLRLRGDKNITLSYVPLNAGTITRDLHS